MMKQTFIFLTLVAVLTGVYFLAERFYKKEGGGIACTMEAKLCPDGSYVGRTGPKCEFTACPSTGGEVQERTTAALGERILNNEVYITPLEVLEDSRCAADVVCIWAGTVRLRTKLEHEGGAQEATLTLGSPTTFAGKRVELTNVAPGTHSQNPVASGEYRFTFAVTETAPLGDGTLRGQMTIGPVCPVERADTPCRPTPEIYAARKIAVFAADKKTLITTITPDAEGRFSVALPAGSYYVRMAQESQGGPGGVSGLPRTVRIESGETIELVIDVDTGIR